MPTNNSDKPTKNRKRRAVAQSKQRFDLYERRLSVFNATMDLIAAVHRRPFDKLYEPLVAFHKAIAESYFLFDQDLLDYLEVFKNKYVDSTISPGPTETAAFYKWFGEQFDEARKRFSKYLSLRELGTPSI